MMESSYRSSPNSTTINGVVINIHGGGSSSNSQKRVRRDASFRVAPPPLGTAGRSGSPAALSTHSSASGSSPYPLPSVPIHSVPVESVRARAIQAVEFYNSNVLAANSSGSRINNNNNNNNNETYKSLGDVFGIQAAVSSITNGDHFQQRKSTVSKNMSAPLGPNPFHYHNGVKPARSVTNVSAGAPPASTHAHTRAGQHAHAHHRLSTYSNVSVPVNTNRFGNADMRASYNERQQQRYQYHAGQPMQHPPPVVNGGRNSMYKSNTSLDLDHEVQVVQEAVSSANNNNYHQMRREYGSHGSIDAVGQQQQQQQNDLRSFDSNDGPAAMSTLQRRPPMLTSHVLSDYKSEGSVSNGSSLEVNEVNGDQSPKQAKKKGFFSTTKEKEKSQKSLFKKLRGKDNSSDLISSKSVDSAVAAEKQADLQAMMDDRHRRRFFSHYDIGSLCASLSVSTHLRSLERRNTTTGASAASAALRGNSNESQDKEEADHGDQVSNELVLSCPYFRNEVGGEGEVCVALSRGTSLAADTGSSSRNFDVRSTGSAGHSSEVSSCHTPAAARGFSLLDSQETFWKTGYCPYVQHKSGLVKRDKNVIEMVDEGATFYKKHFFGQDHQNWFGMDDTLGAVAVSLRREKVPTNASNSNGETFLHPRNIDPEKGTEYGKDQWMYRLLVRTSELLPLRGCVLEESIPALRAEKIKTLPAKEVLDFVCPELQLSSLHLGIQSGPCEEELIRMDEEYVQNKYKVGLMYCRDGQQTEEEMYNNEEGGPAFNQFLDLIGQRVRLKGFNKYKAGLCNKNDSTGLYSVYTEHKSKEVMFHVSTLLPYTPNNRQQLPRKRYIGNDIVTVVFQEPNARPFIPNLKSQFQHVFIVVRALENNEYAVAVSRSKSVPMFGPPLPPNGRFKKNRAFSEFLLTKIINAENAAHRSDKFVSMAIRTRQELLKDLATNYVTRTTLESGSKFNLFNTKKKEKMRPRFTPDCSGLRGALSWRVVAEDCSKSNKEVEAILGISPDSVILIQENIHHDILFLTATKSIIGWTALPNSIRIYFHQGEAVILHSKDWESEDMSEISQRLKAVAHGAPTQEFTLRRNQMGQLGFHVQHDGLITEVENFGYAWQTGLRQGSRLVEICKHPVTALTHEQMVDLLKTSLTVTVTVIPPYPDGSPRRGCNLLDCQYAYGSPIDSHDGDYENLSSSKNPTQQTPSGDKQVYEQQRSLSPPRSSNSSGYGTGSSRKNNNQFIPGGPSNNNNTGPASNAVIMQATNGIPTNGTNDSSSGHSSDERWYDFGDHPPSSSENSPPPVPNRLLGGKGSAFQKVVNGQKNNNTVTVLTNVNNSSSSANSSPSIYQHPPPPTRVGSKNSIKKQANNHYYGGQIGEEKRSGDAKVTYLTEYELNSQKNSYEYLQHERLTAIKSASMPTGGQSENNNKKSPPEEQQQPIVDHLQGVRSAALLQQQLPQRSEDELSGISASSSSISPHSRRRHSRHTNTTPSSGSGSRNESPRGPFLRENPSSDHTNGGGVKLKKPVARNHPHRSSTSTLQEDLLKLIGQDFEEVVMVRPKDSSTGRTPPRKASLNELSLMRSRSRENIVAKDEDTASFSAEDVSFHMARPATVISNTSASSGTSNSNNASVLSKADNTQSPNSPQRRKLSLSQLEELRRLHQIHQQQGSKSGTPLPLLDSKSMDWTSLVNTATKAINTDDDESTKHDDDNTVVEDLELVPEVDDEQRRSPQTTSTLNNVPLMPAEDRMNQLMQKLESLETRLNTESRQKSELAEEVAHLKEENLRLQEESQTAAQQLRRFTEWFFQTIDKN